MKKITSICLIFLLILPSFVHADPGGEKPQKEAGKELVEDNKNSSSDSNPESNIERQMNEIDERTSIYLNGAAPADTESSNPSGNKTAATPSAESSGNCKSAFSIAAGDDPCSKPLQYMMNKEGEGGDITNPVVGPNGKKSYGEDSIYCKKCWSNSYESKISNKDSDYKNFEKELEQKFLKKRVEFWSDRVAQIQSQIDIMKFYASESPLIQKNLGSLKTACGVANVQDVIGKKLSSIVDKYKDRKDRKACPNYEAISSRGFLNLFNSEIAKKIKNNKSKDDDDSKRSRASKELLKERLPGLDYAGSLIHLDENGKVVNSGNAARNFCYSNNMVAQEAFKFDEFKFYNLMVQNIKNNKQASDFACEALKAIKKDRRFGFDAVLDLDSDESGHDCSADEDDRVYLSKFSEMYSKILSQKGSEIFKVEIGEDFDERARYRTGVQSALGSVLSSKDNKVSFEFEEMFLKKNLSSLKDECSSIYDTELESLICGNDKFEPNDQDLLFSLNEDFVKCSENFMVEAGSTPNSKLAITCHNFRKYVCSANAPDVKESKDSENEFYAGSTFQKVKQFNRRRSLESVELKALQGNQHMFSCMNFADKCIKDLKNDISQTISLTEQNKIIFTCVNNKLTNTYRSRQNKTNKTTGDLVVARYLATHGTSCDVLKGEALKACEKISIASDNFVSSACPSCGVDNPIDGLLADMIGDNNQSNQQNDNEKNNRFMQPGNQASASAGSDLPSSSGEQKTSPQNDSFVNSNKIVPSTVSSFVDQLKNQTDTTKKELTDIKNKNEVKGKDPLEDPEYLAKLAQKEALDKQLKDLEASIAKASKANDEKTIEDLRRELRETKKILADSKLQSKTKNSSSGDNSISSPNEGGSSSNNQNVTNNKNNNNTFAGPSETPSPYGANSGNQISNGKFSGGASFGGSDFGSGWSGGASGGASSGSSGNSGGKDSSTYSLGVNGFVRNVSNDVVKKLEKQGDIPVLMITSDEVSQINHNPDYVKTKCPSCYERGIFKAIIEDAEVGKNVAYLSVKKDGQFFIPEVKRTPAAVVEKKQTEPESKSKSSRTRIKKEDMDKAIEEGSK